MINSFYGKLGQGLTERYVYNLLGEKKIIGYSKISVPHYASSCTSLIRSSLIDVVNYFQSIKNVEVLNATTDGLMVAIPKSILKINIKKDINRNNTISEFQLENLHL